MTISEFHASHIRRVRVSFVISGPDLDPEDVTRAIGSSPSRCARRGDPQRNLRGDLVGAEDEGWWELSSLPQVDSKDINDHFEYLLTRLLPRRDALLEMAVGGETFFDVHWASTYLYAGTGPLMSPGVCEGIGALRAGIGFDIYQVDEDDGGRPN